MGKTPGQQEMASDGSTRQWSQWMGVGFEMAGTLGIFSYGGYQADQYFDTEPWCLVGAFAFALVGLLYLIIKRAYTSLDD